MIYFKSSSILPIFGIKLLFFSWLSFNFLTFGVCSTKDSYECLYFDGEQTTSSEGDNGHRLHESKTTYLQAREEIRKVYNSTWPFELNSCQPIYLYLLSRHSIRFPSAKEINTAHHQLPSIAKQLIQGGKLNQNVRDQLSKWRVLYQEHEDQQVTMSGKYQSAVTAGIFYQHFPVLLKIDKNFDVGVSFKERTKDTAKAFTKSLVMMQVNGPNLTYSKANSRVEKVLKKNFSIHKKKLLQVHERCKPLKNGTSSEYIELMNSDTYQNLSAQFSKRNGLSSSLPLKTVMFIRKICSFESAIYGSSVWCALFTNLEWRALLYLEDFKSYTKAYGSDLFGRMSCLTIVDLHSKLKSIVENDDPVKNTLYFGHDTFIKGLYSFLGLFAKFPPYKIDQSKRVCIPKKYEWMTSLITPFGTNMAVSLHRCNQKFKLFTMVNEIPMSIRGCSSGFCDVQQFLTEFNNLAHICDIEQICPVN